MELACLILSLCLEKQTTFVVVTTVSFVGGTRLRAEMGNEVQGTVAEEEE